MVLTFCAIAKAQREAKWNPGETAAQQKAHYDVSVLESTCIAFTVRAYWWYTHVQAIDEAAGVGKVWILFGDINAAVSKPITSLQDNFSNRYLRTIRAEHFSNWQDGKRFSVNSSEVDVADDTTDIADNLADEPFSQRAYRKTSSSRQERADHHHRLHQRNRVWHYICIINDVFCKLSHRCSVATGIDVLSDPWFWSYETGLLRHSSIALSLFVPFKSRRDAPHAFPFGDFDIAPVEYRPDLW